MAITGWFHALKAAAQAAVYVLKAYDKREREKRREEIKSDPSKVFRDKFGGSDTNGVRPAERGERVDPDADVRDPDKTNTDRNDIQ